jgi:hypothetical protein
MAELIAQNRDVIGLMILLGTFLLVNVLLHWLVICPRLYRHGARLPTGLLFWRVFGELRSYKNLTAAKGRPLTFYYFGFILSWFNLLLAFVLALRLLWLQTHPGGL